jgi:integrase
LNRTSFLYRTDTISPATVNKDLRHLKAILNVANEWGYLIAMPKIRMLKEPGRLPRFVTTEHFAALYRAADKAKRPSKQAYPAADWWKALLAMAYMTGWRINELLALKRADVDLEAGTAITWHEDNKGKRDERVKLHPVIVEHLKRVPGFTPNVFPWAHGLRQLYGEFAELQDAAGIKLPCSRKHEHTAFCHVYGFHDLRRPSRQ